MAIDYSGEPLAELKQWLAIATATDDALLVRQLAVAGEMCRRFTGIADADWPKEWAALAPALRQGIVRFAAHQYRSRDNGETTAPPAAIAALWAPYRLVRL